jgi:predicted Na+-dependent transporter
MSFAASLLGSRFWIPAYVCFFLGFVIPGQWESLRFVVPLCLGGILYFTCLKLPLHEVVGAITDRTRWRQVSWMTAIKLLVLPLVAWAMALVIAPQWAPGVLLVCAMPAGLSSIAFTDIVKGNHVLALLLVLAGSMLCPLSVPGLLLALGPSTHLDPTVVMERAGYILTLLTVPFILAQLTRRFAHAVVVRHHQRWGAGAVISSCLLGLVSVLVNRDLWAAWTISQLLTPLALVCFLSACILVFGWWIQRLIGEHDAKAFTCGCAYMNNGLAIAFAVRFFHDDPTMVLPAVLMQIPMIGSVALIGRFGKQAQPAPVSSLAS